MLGALHPSVGASTRTPNVLIVLVDDLGWSDLSCYGNPFVETPQVDALAREGMKFTRAYADPVCMPSRVALHAGRYSVRWKMTDIPNGHRRPWAALVPPEIRWQLPPEAVTLAEALAKVGYTAGTFGKWHLGFRTGFQPEDQGYLKAPSTALQGEYGGALSRWAEENPEKSLGAQILQCARFIEQNRHHPFLCIASLTTVHTPLQARADLLRKYREKFARVRTTIDPGYAAMCEAMDEGVGWLRRVLRANELAASTLVLFLSDNGGVIEERGFLPSGQAGLVTHNWPLRGEKGQLYEGGIRIPLIAHWPGQVGAGSVADAPVHVVDLLPTLLELAGAAGSGTAGDGVSLAPLLRGTARLPARDLFWHYPHYHHASPASAVSDGKWKLIHWYETGEGALYHLADDVAEQDDVSAAHPEKRRELEERLRRWLKQVEADLPVANPAHDPARELIWGERISREKMADESFPLGLP